MSPQEVTVSPAIIWLFPKTEREREREREREKMAIGFGFLIGCLVRFELELGAVMPAPPGSGHPSR